MKDWRVWAGALFGAAILHSLWSLTVGFYNPIMDEHSFRQTQTALTAYFLGKGSPFFAYETPVLGYPWSIPFELPVYEWLTGKLAAVTGLELETMGRLVGRAFFYLALVPLYSLFRTLRFAPVSRWLGMSFYLLSPLYLYWSRSILIESSALFFALAYTALFARALRTRRNLDWCFAAIAGSLAGTTKSTTAFAFFLANGLLFLLEYRTILFHPAEWKGKGIVAAVLVGCAFPTVVSLAWLKFSDVEKAMNPLANFILSNNLNSWNFGTWQQRVAGSTWYMFFRKTIHSSIGHRSTWIVSVLLLWFLPSRHRWTYLTCSILFLIAPMTFTNLHVAHNYYWYANGIFLLVAMVAVVDGLRERAEKSRAMAFAFVAFPILMGAQELRQFHKFELTWQNELNDGPLLVGKEVRKLSSENDVLYIPGFGWHPAFAYFSRRRAIMDPKDYGIDDSRLHEALLRTERNGFHVALLLMCLDYQHKPELLARARNILDFDPQDIGTGMCEIHRIRAIKPATI